MKYAEVENIRNHLVILGQDQLPVGYEIGKNIHRCDQVIDEVDKVVEKLVQQYADKGDDGRVLYGPADASGRRKPVMPPEKELALQEQLDKVNDDDSHVVRFHKIPEDRIKSLSLRGAALGPLFGTIIEEQPEKV